MLCPDPALKHIALITHGEMEAMLLTSFDQFLALSSCFDKMLSFHLCLGRPWELFVWSFLTNTWNAFVILFIHAASPASHPNSVVQSSWKISSRSVKSKSKGIPVTSRGGPYGCETLRFPHFLDIRLRDGGEFVSLTRWPPFTLKNIPDTHFVRGWVDPRAMMRLEGLGQLKKKSSDLIGTWTRNLLACRIVPERTTLPRAPSSRSVSWEIPHRSLPYSQEPGTGACLEVSNYCEK
jgi:hypothetical protein